MAEQSSVIAIALFFDDARLEVGGKITLVGQYIADLVLNEQNPIDRISIAFYLRVPKGFPLSSIKARISVPGQAPMEQDIAIGQLPSTPRPESAFSSRLTTFLAALRFPPLRAGDVIDAWLIVNGEEFPAGRLYVQPSGFSNPSPTAVL